MTKTTVSLQKKTFETIEKVSKDLGVTKGALMGKLVAGLDLENQEVKPIVLQIPIDLLKDHKQELQDWLETRSNGIINHYYSE